MAHPEKTVSIIKQEIDLSPFSVLQDFDYDHPRTSSCLFIDSVKRQKNELAGKEPQLAQAALGIIQNLGPGSRHGRMLEAKGWQKRAEDIYHLNNIRSAQSAGDYQRLAAYHDYSVYDTYAKCDIIEGLAGIGHAATDNAIVACFSDSDLYVRAKAEAVMKQAGRNIYPETLAFLASQPQRRELALDILENNSSAGYSGKFIHPETAQLLDRTMHEGDPTLQERAAIVVSLLQSRTEGGLRDSHPDLLNHSIAVLSPILEARVTALNDPAIFSQEVTRVTAENLPVLTLKYNSGETGDKFQQKKKLTTDEVRGSIMERYIPAQPADITHVFAALNRLLFTASAPYPEPRNAAYKSTILLLSEYDQLRAKIALAARDRLAQAMVAQMDGDEAFRQKRARELQEQEKLATAQKERERQTKEMQEKAAMAELEAKAEGITLQASAPETATSTIVNVSEKQPAKDLLEPPVMDPEDRWMDAAHERIQRTLQTIKTLQPTEDKPFYVTVGNRQYRIWPPTNNDSDARR